MDIIEILEYCFVNKDPDLTIVDKLYEYLPYLVNLDHIKFLCRENYERICLRLVDEGFAYSLLQSDDKIPINMMKRFKYPSVNDYFQLVNNNLKWYESFRVDAEIVCNDNDLDNILAGNVTFNDSPVSGKIVFTVNRENLVKGIRLFTMYPQFTVIVSGEYRPGYDIKDIVDEVLDVLPQEQIPILAKLIKNRKGVFTSPGPLSEDAMVRLSPRQAKNARY